MTGSVAATIQGEAGSNPRNQFAVAATIYNRLQAGTYGSSASQIVNAPNQYTGSAAPNASAIQLARAIEDGSITGYGEVGNAVNFQTTGSNTTLGRCSTCANIGGNNFSDNFGPPTAQFVPPSLTNPSIGGSVSPADVAAAASGANPAGTDPADPFGLGQQGGAESGNLPGSPLNPAPGDTGGLPMQPQIGAGLGAIVAAGGNYLVRVLLAILGIGLLIVAAYAFTSGESAKQTVIKLAGKVPVGE